MTDHDSTAPARHPIAVVAERTGLSQDVLRVWERRYGAVHPERGPGGQRLYRDTDVERLRLLHAATRAGRSIGSIAHLPRPELTRLVDEDAAARDRATLANPRDFAIAADDIQSALPLVRALDAPALDASLRRAAASLGVAPFLEMVAAPLMRRVGDEWHAGRLSPAQEHLASSVVHDIVAESMRTLAQRTPNAPRMLIATPAGEQHALGALLVGATAALERWNVIYLGADLPAADIASAAIAANARVVAVSIVYVDDPERVLHELRALRAELPTAVALVAGGSGAEQLARELALLGVRVQTSLTALRDELRRATNAA